MIHHDRGKDQMHTVNKNEIVIETVIMIVIVTEIVIVIVDMIVIMI